MFAQKEDKSILVQALDALPLNDRQMIRLRWGEEMPYKEIGDLLGIPEATAKKRTQRALWKLRDLLEN
jgi:RNA polymerase sigma factor (sigma-70 family)